MRLCTVRSPIEQAAVMIDDGLVLIADINDEAGTKFPTDMLALIRSGEAGQLADVVAEVAAKTSLKLPKDTPLGPPYRNPPKIWGFGPNYKRHANDLEVDVRAEIPDAPGSYMKPSNTIIGPDDTILLPPQSQRVTAEAELGVIIGKECRNISAAEADSVVFGYTIVLDMTAEDILRRNLRYISRAKCFETFFSFGPVIVTADELPDVADIHIATVVNGEVGAEGPVSGMTYDPAWLLSFQSEMTTLEVGDVIATGTPGASVLKDGDIVEARLSELGVLRNRVRAVGG